MKKYAGTPIEDAIKRSTTERCLAKYFAPVIISNPGRIGFLLLYAIMITASIIGVLNLKVQFDIKFLVSENSWIWSWYQAHDQYFETGSTPIITYVESDTADWSS